MPLLPRGIRVRMRDDPSEGAVALSLARRRMWPAGLITGAMFAIFAGVGWTVAGTMSRHDVRDVFDLMFLLFQAFWLLGWSVGVFFLAALTVLLLFYRDSARLQDGRLVFVTGLGPIKIIADYELSKIRNLRLQNVGGPENAQIRFDYEERSNNTLGDTLPRADAERLIQTIKNAGVVSSAPPETVIVPPPPRVMPAAPKKPAPAAASSSPIFSSAVLVGANLMPLAGVLFLGWDLSTIMVLFWAESAVIGFYTALKIVMAEKLAAILGVPFFIGHFGGFMVMHFLFIYAFFIRGAHAMGPGPGARDALLRIFVPLWTPLAALFVSHGVSFVSNFIGRREYEGASMQALMAAPYSRIMVMQMALIFGGWVVLLLKTPVPALALLVVIKTALDLAAHKKEHQASQ
jgi:hypothetical protein